MDFEDEIAHGVLDGVEKSPGNPNRWRQLMLLAFDQKDTSSFRTLQIISSGLDRMIEAQRLLEDEPNPEDTGQLALPPQIDLSNEELAAYVPLARNPNDSEGLKTVATFCLHKRSLPDVARQHIERALELSPANTDLKQLLKKAIEAETRAMPESAHVAVSLRDTSELPEITPPKVGPTEQYSQGKPLHGERTQTTNCQANATPASNPTQPSLQTASLDNNGRRMLSIEAQADELRAAASPKNSAHLAQHEAALADALPVSKETREIIKAASPEQLIKQSMTFARAGRLDEASIVCRIAVRRDPKLELGWETWSAIGVALFERGRLDDAIEAYEQALLCDDQALETWFNLGVTYFETNKTDDALRCYMRALALSPDNPKINCNMGTVYFQNELYSHAVQHFTSAVRAKPDYARAWDNLAAALGALHLYDEAIKACEQALRCVPDHVDARFKLGTLHFQQGRNTEAMEHFQQVIEQRPDDGPSHAYLAMISVQGGERETARAFCEHAGQHETSPQLLGSAWASIGHHALKDSKFSEAADAFRQTTELLPRDFEPWQYLGRALRKAGNLTDAEHAFFFAVQMNSECATGWRYLGLTRFDQHNFEGAAAAQLFATELTPEDCSLWLELAASYQMMRHHDDAVDALRKALEADPGNVQALKSLCLTLIDAGRQEEASEVAARAAGVDQYNSCPDAQAILGKAQAAVGKNTCAIEHYEKAVALDASLVETWKALGSAYTAHGEHEKASAALNKAVELQS